MWKNDDGITGRFCCLLFSCRLFFTGQNRGLWIYKDIYEIHGTEKTEAVAVQINDRYYIAKRQ